MHFGLFGGAKSSGQGHADDSQGYSHFIDSVLLADELGYRGLFVVEHHFTGMGQVSASLALLSYLAGRTSRIRLGTAVVVVPWHNPALLAEQAATVDLLSGGRFDFGVGKGYRDDEFAGFCVPKSEAGERFDETMQVIRKAWSAQERFSHHGKRWHFENVLIEPRPIQNPHPPFWMGAGSPESIRRAASEGYNLLLDQIGSIELTSERVRIYREELSRQGVPYDGSRVAVTRALHIVTSDEERRQAYVMRAETLKRLGGLVRGQPASFAESTIANDDAALIGTPDEIVARLKLLEASGVEYVLLVNASKHALRVFAGEVMPEFAIKAPARQAIGT